MRIPDVAVEGWSAPSPRPASLPRVLIVSESALMRAGMYALLHDQPLLLVEAIAHLEHLASSASARRAQAALIAPIGGLTTKLGKLLTHQIRSVRLVFLLPPAAVKIHGETLQAIGNIQCLPLQAPREAIVWALTAPAPRLIGGVLTERVSRGPGGRLTPRQQEVLDCLARGLSNCQIAAKLFIREDTVKAHLGAVYRKLGVKSRAEAIAAYLEVG
jgi:DNA-binding CsgD family transcriptional regulator